MDLFSLPHMTGIRRTLPKRRGEMQLAAHAETWEWVQVDNSKPKSNPRLFLKGGVMLDKLRSIFGGVELNVVLGIANALAAIASACVAIFALSVALSQVRVAKTQIEATYLSNLYTKQIDGIGAFETAIGNLSLSIMRDIGIEITTVPSADFLNEARNTAKERRSQYMEAYLQILSSANIASLVLPSRLQHQVSLGTEASKDLVFDINSFTGLEQTTSPSDQFSVIQAHFRALMDKWADDFFNCAHKILSVGKAITDENVEQCKFRYAGKKDIK